ncbi:bestrophin family protein [Neorhodopirellula lusitana]|uniref:bestrophin family protein n=1 Tax=Neorhodopirellula lusitana TaxID=445327 RepID=UPI00384E7819
MITDTSRTTWRMVGELWWPMLPIIGYVLVVSWVDLAYHLEVYEFPISILGVLGTLIGLLLAFRTNSSYDRWWEARTLWGAIVNDSRTWTRQLVTFTSGREEAADSWSAVRQMSLRQAAWCYALSRNLRGQDPLVGMEGLVNSYELERYRDAQNVPNEILHRQGLELRELKAQGEIELYEFVELERTLMRLTNSMGGCERIKNTPFPALYSRMVHGLIYGFVIFLPFGLVRVPTPGLIFISLALSFGFLLVDHVAIYLQDPFSSRPSDTPTLALSRTIEINIRQMLGETQLPEKIEPINGVLY